jgi:hypothetical protein
MTKQEELLAIATDTNLSVKQQIQAINNLVEVLRNNQAQQPAERQRIGFVQNTINSITENPKTTIAGLSSFVLAITQAFFPQYSNEINLAITGITGTGLALSKDAKTTKPVTEPTENTEMYG